MDYGHIHAFCTVVEAGSISKAARNLFVTQPAVSVKVQELEEHYQVKLLDRTNKGVTPTEVGLFVYNEGKRIVSMFDNIHKEINRTRNPVDDMIIAAASTIGNFGLPCTIFLFKEKHPNFRVLMEICNSKEVVNRLLMRRVEVGLIEGPLKKSHKELFARDEIYTRWLMRNKLFLVAPNVQPYQSMTSIKLDDLRKLPLVIREPGSGIRASIEEALAEQSLDLSDLNVTMELSSINAIVSAITSDNGLSLLPKMALRKELRYKILKTIPIQELQLNHDYTLLYYSHLLKKQPYNAFIKLLTSKERGFC